MSSTPVKFAYRHLPVTNRFGSGSYTYTLIQEGQSSVLRYEVFADTLQQAIFLISSLRAFTGYQRIDNNTWELLPTVFDGCRWFIYLD